MIYMGIKEYDIPWQAATEKVDIARKTIIILGILVFIVIIATTLDIMDRVGMGVRSCEFKTEKTPIYDYGISALTKKTAEQMIMEKVSGVTFIGNTIETCGAAFVFKGEENIKYVVCQNGAIYRQVFSCKNLITKEKISPEK